MKMIDHNHFICHLILGTFTEYPYVFNSFKFFLIYFNFVFPFFSYFIRLRTSLIYCI